jgi:hypothetical protein
MNASRAYNATIGLITRMVMTADDIRKHIVATPFRPFWIHVADGRQIAVRARDFILVSPQGRLVDIYQPDDAQDILEVFHVTGVSFEPAPPVAANGQTQPSTA